MAIGSVPLSASRRVAGMQAMVERSAARARGQRGRSIVGRIELGIWIVAGTT